MSVSDDPPTGGRRPSPPEGVKKTWGGPASPRDHPLGAIAMLAAALTLTGCAVVTIAGAAAGAAISITGAVVSTGVKVTGKVIEKTIDVVTPGAKPES